VALWTVLAFAGLAALAAQAEPAAEPGPGVRDLRHWDFERDGIASLEGQWAICWDAFVTPETPDCPGGWQPVPVPGLWSEPSFAERSGGGRGFATYRLRIRLPAGSPPLSLRSGAPFTAFALWLDGRFQGGAGEVGRTPREATARAHNRVFVVPERDSRDGELGLLAQVSNHEFRGGGLRRQWLLGTRDQIRDWVVIDTLAYGAFGTLSAAIGLLYLLQFVLRPGEAERGYFGLAALTVGVRVVVASPSDVQQLLFPEMSFTTLVRIEYLTTSLMIIAGAGYFAAKLGDVIPKWVARGIQAGGLATGVVALLAPFPVALATLRPIEVFAVAALASGFVGYAIAVRRGRRYVRWNLVAISLFALAVVHDIVRVETGLGAPLELFAFFMVIWLISEAWAMSRSFMHSIDTVESLSEELIASNEELRETNSAVTRFVPYEFIERLDKRSIREVALGDHVEAQMNVMFCDIRAFTGLVAAMDAKQAFDFINRFLKRMEPLIHAHDGFVNQYLGDCIMALFPAAGDSALRAGIEMSRALSAMNGERRGRGASGAELRIGIGVNAGPLMLGTIGGTERLSGGVIGDAVNIASRVEALTKVYDTTFVVTDRTVASLTDPSPFDLRELDRVTVRGRSDPIAIFEVIDALDEPVRSARQANVQRFAEARALFASDDLALARKAFEACRERDPSDRASAFYLERILRPSTEAPVEA
jgi:class 3 adenylate cyclase